MRLTKRDVGGNVADNIPSKKDLQERWCPLSISVPTRDEQRITLWLPGQTPALVTIRFGDIWWTEAEA